MQSSQHILNKRTLRSIVDQIDPTEILDPDVEHLLLDLADDFIYNCTQAACRLAKHRGGDTLEVKDLQLHLGTYSGFIPLCRH